MPKYMVELSHTPDDCVAAFGDMEQQSQDFLGEIYWGCMSGVHNGWVVVDADSEQQVRDQVPKSLQGDVTITEVEDVGPEMEYAIDPNTAHPGQDPPFWS